MGSRRLHQNLDRLGPFTWTSCFTVYRIPNILHHEQFTRTSITRSTHSKALGICSGIACCPNPNGFWPETQMLPSQTVDFPCGRSSLQTQLEYGGIQQTVVSNPPSRSRHWILLGPPSNFESMSNFPEKISIHYSRAGTISPFDVLSIDCKHSWRFEAWESAAGHLKAANCSVWAFANKNHCMQQYAVHARTSTITMSYERVSLTLTTTILHWKRYHE